MSNRVSLPMYDIHPPITDALWAALRPRLQALGINAPLQVVRPGDLLAHWRDDSLLLGQTCGYPLMTQLADAQVVGCFHYAAPGCDGPRYRSFLVAREEAAGNTLADFRGRSAACNAPDSHSGYNALRLQVARLGGSTRFFQAVVFSGSHDRSLAALQRGEADLAAIDCVTFALLRRYRPERLRGLAVIGETPLAPGLPLITSRLTRPDTLCALRAALHQLVDDDACTDALIAGFSPASRSDYIPVLEWQREAAARGVDAL